MSNSESSTRKRKLFDLFARGLFTEADLEAALRNNIDPNAAGMFVPQTLSGVTTGPRASVNRDPQRGEVLSGMFELVQQIGSGAVGVVWKTRDLIGSRDVCVKLLPSKMQNDETELALNQA